jgi:probable HAF family extracellular repeat protein
MRFRLTILFALLPLLTHAVESSQVASRSVRPARVLTQLPPGASPEAINDRGDIAGVLVGDFPTIELFHWSNKWGYVVIFSGTHDLTWGYPAVTDLNDRGEVVGYITGDGERRGFLWSPRGGLRILDVSIARGINNRGQIVGDCLRPVEDALGERLGAFPCVVTRAGVRELPVGSGSFGGSAYDISDRGDIAGTVILPNDGERGALWRRGALTVLQPGMGDSSVVANAVNSRGILAGFHYGEYVPSYGLMWNSSGEIVAIGPEESFLYDINDRGMAVGAFVANREQGVLAALLMLRGEAIGLSGLGGATSLATAINARGQIVGIARTPDGQGHAVIWDASHLGRPPRK